MKKQSEILRATFDEATANVQSCAAHSETIEEIVEMLVACFEAGGRLLVCGNGGSCADASHFATELSVRFERDRLALPAICLGAAASELTALGNDFNFQETFRRLVRAHGKRGDCLFAISTSGKSANVLGALQEAASSGLKTVALLGKGGGDSLGIADIELLAPGRTTARVQEAHQVFIHAICALIDAHFAG